MTTCDYKKCKAEIFNDNGALWLDMSGGYGDFVDIFGDRDTLLLLCHKHAHKFANFLGKICVTSFFRICNTSDKRNLS